VKILILFLLSYPLFAQNTIRFSPLPMESASKTLEIFKPFIEYIEKKSGKKIELVYRATNSEIIEGLKTKQIDLAHFGPLPYAKLTKEYKNIIPIVQFLEKDGQNSYTCTLFKRKGAKIDLQKIQHKKFALTHKYSTCGYVFVEDILKKYDSSLTNNDFKYLGSHYTAIADVVIGDFDIGGVKTSIFDKFSYLDVEAIDIGEQNPSLMLVANTNTLTKEDISQLQNIIISATKRDKKDWDIKINSIAKIPDIKALEEYKQRIENIEIEDER
jgi:phosphonate transport system substrate-binding protein